MEEAAAAISYGRIQWSGVCCGYSRIWLGMSGGQRFGVSSDQSQKRSNSLGRNRATLNR
jgi:hypothetical protein